MPNDQNAKFDMLFILLQQGGGEDHDGQMCMRVVRDLTVDDVPKVMEEIQDLANYDVDPGEGNFDIQGAVELARAQTHFLDTNIMQPHRFVTCEGADHIGWLDMVPEWKRPITGDTK